ncbi:hypothetical protein CHUAL_006244 [Chamberlinius hualienensis]
MCDVCSDVLELIATYDTDVAWSVNHQLSKNDFVILCNYVQQWSERQCMCVFKDFRHYDRFNHLIQGVLFTSIQLLDLLKQQITSNNGSSSSNKTIKSKLDEDEAKSKTQADAEAKFKSNDEDNEEIEIEVNVTEVGSSLAEWTLDEKERLLVLVTKVFLINFPHYTAYKHAMHSKLDEMCQQEVTILSVHCDIHDSDIPIHLLRNVCCFCESDVLVKMTECFADANPDTLPFCLAKAMISIVSNLKHWMNVAAVVKFLVPLRTNVIKYMCKLCDKDLRAAGVRSMSEFMWTAVKDPLDSHFTFDKEGLDLAFKYFTSSTLTMRLAGISHINNHVTMYTELANSESVVEAEVLGLALANWLQHNRIIENIFGPNIHVEIIKQSHLVLNFLAQEGYITDEHVDCMWSAAQLKHCSKQVHDLLHPLIKNLENGRVRHLYRLLCRLDPSEHTEQTLYLASALLKVLWSNRNVHLSHPRLSTVATVKVGSKDSSDPSISLDSDDDISDARTREILNQEPCLSEANVDILTSDAAAQIRNWVEDPNSFTSSDNDSDGAEDSSPAHRSANPPTGLSRELILRASTSHLVSSDSEGRGVEDEEETGSDDEEEEEEEEETDNHRPRLLLGRLQQKRMLLRRNKRRTTPSKVSGGGTVTLKRRSVSIPGDTPVKQICLTEGDDPQLAKRRRRHSSASTANPVSMIALNFLCLEQSNKLQHADSDLIEDIMSPDEGSCSSRMSAKSEKNMADFDGEESGCDEELLQLASAHQCQLQQQSKRHKSHHHHHPYHHSKQPLGEIISPPASANLISFDLENVCKTGHTLLWDLLQDDIVNELGKGLAAEAEKVLSSLVCWSTDRMIRMKFIEGCLHNLAANTSVYLALRLLPRLFGSFQQYRGRADTHSVVMWAEKEHHMMDLFFNNLLVYMEQVRRGKKPHTTIHSHQVMIQVRLQFLTYVFSANGSPDYFQLSLDQVDALWSALAGDSETADDLFSWLLTQAKNREEHALGMGALNHIFTEKLPLLQPETTSMTSLNLIQHIGNVTRTHGHGQTAESEAEGMDQLWGIALRANSTDVSMAAIQYLNCYYINGHPKTLEKEEEFIEKCMCSLTSVLPDIEKGDESSLMVVQRALILLKTHLETFQRRYAFHLRMWHLDGRGIISHHRPIDHNSRSPIRVSCQPAGSTSKVILELLSTDYIADLRAEVTHWWEMHHRVKKSTRQTPSSDSVEVSMDDSSESSPSTMVSPILGAMLTDGPIRIITQGQELTTDLDERTLGEIGLKDMQMMFVSVGACRPLKKKDDNEAISMLPPPPMEKLPLVLLLRPDYMEQLFKLIQQLGELKTIGRGGCSLPHVKGHLLSWRVWEILMMLPTCPSLLTDLQSFQLDFGSLLDPRFPHKLMYALQIVERLARCERSQPLDPTSSVTVSDQSISSVSWSEQFVQKGGLGHLFDIFMSGVLQKQQERIWSEWNQDCLAYLLKLMYQLGVESCFVEESRRPSCVSDSLAALTYMTSSSGLSCSSSSTSLSITSSGPRRKSKKQRKSTPERLLLPRLNPFTLDLLSDIEAVAKRIISILYDAGRLPEGGHYKMSAGGRGQVVHYALSFLLSWALCCDRLKTLLFSDHYLTGWLHHLLLDDPEPSVRQEVCSSLYRLCLGTTSDGRSGTGFTVPLLNCLVQFLPNATAMKPCWNEGCGENEKDKEPYGPSCREYFWLVCRLFDSLEEETLDEAEGSLDLNNMTRQLASSILSREYYETRHSKLEDDGLVGLLNLCCSVIKHNPPFKDSPDGQEFLKRIVDCLFALPSPQQRHLPLCKSQQSRSAAYDLLVELCKSCFDNYCILHSLLMQQHSPNSHSPYPWDYWPHEDGRSDCGYVGLTNLGATCYMASCMQHLYMMPQARASILSAKGSLESKHESTLKELQRMFAYLLESERKAYNPRSFCKVYTMDHQPLNTGEQKDMAEFFTDLISKLEEMTPLLKELVKTLFCGVITNNVVSLDCPHVSRTLEEFYTVRCQVADMRNLQESLDEVTVKDTLEGDNMYTCSQCGKKVRAEKRACLKRLPRILCFNTMRYTFNMVTMTKEKVNTHFSFPLRLDMSKYTEKQLMSDQYRESGETEDESSQSDEYDLIGVTVHTGTADGGHYYSFIRDRSLGNRDKWLLFNDAEVKLFDPTQIAAECFGGEMTSKTYDSVTDKFMDFSFEKTNSAYMLFYERVSGQPSTTTLQDSASLVASSSSSPSFSIPTVQTVELPKDLADWIWEDNMQFLQDKNILEHNYFNFMWQVCSQVPHTLTQQKDLTEVTLLAAKLSTFFVLETLIHAKEKPTMVQWIELSTKLFNSNQSACEWFLEHMANEQWWPVQILIRCPNQVVRQMFLRLCIHVINKLRAPQQQQSLTVSHDAGGDNNEAATSTSPSSNSTTNSTAAGLAPCVTHFIKKLLTLIEHGANQHTKHLTEYFSFLLEFAKMGPRECQFLLSLEAISTIVNFYLGHKSIDYVDPVSDDEDEEADDVMSLSEDKYKPASLEKMITLIATLVEKSRGDDHQLHLSSNDLNAVAGGKGYPFLYQQLRDNINVRQTCNLVFSLSRWNETLAVCIVSMVFHGISQNPEQSQPFFKLLTMLVEFVGGPPGLPAFTRLVLQHIWEVAETCPHQCLEWLATQVPRNKLVHSWVLQNMESWVEPFLIAHGLQRVRNAAAMLLVSLIPSSHFKNSFRTARNMLSPQKEIPMSSDAVIVLHLIYDLLLRLLKRAKHYVEMSIHGTTKLSSYFALMTYCLVSHAEKLMFGQYFMDLWQLFQPKLSEPAIAVHHNKQALLIFWYQVCVDCPENVKLIVQNAHVTKNIAFNYILADHEDQDVMIFNRFMLPAYYGLLRLCCQQSRPFTRQLANHQNIHWAFKNITPYPAQYPMAVDELYKLMRLFVAKYSDSSESELKEIAAFKCNTVQLYLSILDGRSNWVTLIAVLKILLETNEDRMNLVCNSGLPLIFEAFQTLHMMYHEATACHVTGEVVELLGIILEVLRSLRIFRESKGVKPCLYPWKDKADVIRKLLTLLNSYSLPNLQHMAMEVLKELVVIYPAETLQALVPVVTHSHSACQENAVPMPMGPYFPHLGQKQLLGGCGGAGGGGGSGSKGVTSRPPAAFLQMTLHPNQLEAPKGIDRDYDQSLIEYFNPYHQMIDMVCRVAVNQELMNEALVNLSAAIGTEGVPLHLAFFPKLWIDVYQTKNIDRKYVDMLSNSFYFTDYVSRVLLTERSSLNNVYINQFLFIYLPKIQSYFVHERAKNILNSSLNSLQANLSSGDVDSFKLNGDLMTLKLLQLVNCPHLKDQTIVETIQIVISKCEDRIRHNADVASTSTAAVSPAACSSSSSGAAESTSDKTSDEKSMEGLPANVATSPPEKEAGEKEESVVDNKRAREELRSCHWSNMWQKTLASLKLILENPSTSSPSPSH